MGLKYVIPYTLDDPRTTLLHKEIIKTKPFLRRLYEEWYNEFISAGEQLGGKMLEIGSGGGFLKDIYPKVITSDILPLGCDMTFSAEQIPLKDAELSAIVMLNVLHHIPHPAIFLSEAQRTLRTAGKVIMIEPANSFFGRFIYRNFHHEPFEPKGGWEIDSSGPLSGANGALPWIIFERDIAKFEKDFPKLKVNKIKYHSPLLYLLSGGVSRKAFVPFRAFGIIKGLETLLSPLSRIFGMFVTIELEKK